MFRLNFTSRLIALLAIDIIIVVIYTATPITVPGLRGAVALTQLIFLALTFGLTLIRVAKDF